MKFVWPPIAKALDERAQKIAAGLAASDKAKAELASANQRGDLLCTFIQRLRDGRPHEFHREQHQQQEDDGLNEQGRVDTHGNTFLCGR